MVLFHGLRQRVVFGALALTVFLGVVPVTTGAPPGKLDVLHVGTSGTLTAEKDHTREKGALMTLQNFIKDETGLENEIVRQKNWGELADKMAKGQLQIGVFQGYEFAWAQEQHAGLKPLALAVNVYRYPVAYVVTRRDDAAKDFAGLQGHTVCLPDTGQPYLRLFVEHESQAAGKELNAFFSKVTAAQNIEDALDDLVDAKVQAVAVDRAALESYKQRKPGRFKQLKEVAQSQPFPPAVIASYDKVLDDATVKRFRDGMLAAGEKEKGKTLLTLFHLTSFDAVPDDFGTVLEKTRKTYSPPMAPSK